MPIIDQLSAGHRAFIKEHNARGEQHQLYPNWMNIEVRMPTAVHQKITRTLFEVEKREAERTGRVSTNVQLDMPTHIWGMAIVRDDALPANTVRFSYDGVMTEITITA